MNVPRSAGLGRRALMRGALAAGLGGLLPGCPSVRLDHRLWINRLGTETILPRWLISPGCAGEIAEAVSDASRAGRRIRMTGNRHSFSDVALNEDVVLCPERLTAIFQDGDRGLRPGVDASKLLRVQTGVSIHALNRHLCRRGLALENMGGAEVQTFVGAASTGTHGSGCAYGPLASQIVSIDLVTADGEMLRVEPAGGITDGARFPGKLPEDPGVRVRLVQDTNLFDAVAVSLGSMGVIYAVTLRVVDRYWLIERKTLTSWEELVDRKVVRGIVEGSPIRALLPDRTPVPGVADDREPDHVEIWYTPYASAEATHEALITLRWRVSERPPGAGGERGSPLFTPSEHFTRLLDELGLLADLLPKKTADIRKLHVTALRNMAQSYYANISFDVFSIGILNEIHAYGVELAFSIDDTIEAVSRNCALASRLAELGMHHTSPLSVRFVKQSPALLAMQHGRPTMMLEMGVLVGLTGAEDLLKQNEELFVAQMKARPHWGLDRNILRSDAAVARLYPDTWSRWKDARRTLNAVGTFDGLVTDRLGISKS